MNDDILPVREIGRLLGRNHHVIMRAWRRAGLPVFPVETIMRDGRRRVVSGLSLSMVKDLLNEGGLRRRQAYRDVGPRVARKFGVG